MSTKKTYWLDDRRNVNKIVYALYAVCAVLVVADFFYHKHIHFEYENRLYNFENWFGFFGWFGFIACVCLVLAARAMRKPLKREEDYYDQ